MCGHAFGLLGLTCSSNLSVRARTDPGRAGKRAFSELDCLWFLLDAIHARACSRYMMTFSAFSSGKNVLSMRCLVLVPGSKIENIVGHVLNFENEITFIARYETDLYSANSFMQEHVLSHDFENSFLRGYNLVSIFKTRLPGRNDSVIAGEFFLDACSQRHLSRWRTSCKHLQVYILFGWVSFSPCRCTYV